MMSPAEVEKRCSDYLKAVDSGHNYLIDQVRIYGQVAMVTYNTAKFLRGHDKWAKHFVGPLMVDRKSGWLKQYPTALSTNNSMLGDFSEKVFYYAEVLQEHPGFSLGVPYYRCHIKEVKDHAVLYQNLVAYRPSALDQNGVGSTFMSVETIQEKVDTAASFVIESYHSEDLLRFLFFNGIRQFAEVEVLAV